MKLPRLSLPCLMLAAAVVAQPASAATFRWANDGDVATMDPDMLQETVQLSFLANIYEPLIRRDKDLKLEPALATSWEHTSPTVWRFHLRPNVKYQDGTPFTADDVIFSLHRIQAQTSAMRAPMSMVKEARKVDDLTVDLETRNPDPILPQEVTNFLIMSKAWCEAHNATEPVIFGDGEQSRDFTFVENAVQANLLACEAPNVSGRTFNVGTGGRFTLNETVELLGKISGKPLKPKYEPPREGDIRDSQADITQARLCLGYDPPVTFEEGLARTFDWYRSTQTKIEAKAKD